MAARIRPGDEGESVAELQKAVNDTLKGRSRLGTFRCEEDSVVTTETFEAARLAAAYLGFDATTLDIIDKGEISRHVYAVLTGQKQFSTPAMKKRAEARKPAFSALRKEPNSIDAFWVSISQLE